MYGGYEITRVAISASNGPRAPMFAPAAKEIFGLGGVMGHAPILRYSLGQAAQDYYTRAKTAIAKFDSLVARTAKIANKTVRDQIIADYGLTNRGDTDKAGYMREALAYDVSEAEKYRSTTGTIAYEEGFPARGPSRGRVTKLENFNRDFEAAVTNAETTYGILPAPVVIERTVTAPGAATNVLPYILVGGGVLVALAVVGVI